MSYNGSGTFQINSSGQPVVTGTVISSTAFNALTADLATGLSTAITKDGQTTTTVRVPFAQGISSTLVTDATSAITGSIITAGGISTQKALWVGTTATVAGATTLAATTATSLTVSGTTTLSGGANIANLGGANKIINGDMRIDQRNAGAAVTTLGSYPVDRFQQSFSHDGAQSFQQSSTVPAGFSTSVKFTTTTADASLAATQYSMLRHIIEGRNIADLNWGTADAKAVTLSFWVRSNLTGTFGGALTNAAGDRSYPFTYVINSANTWESKSVTVAGDTSGTWLTTTGIGIDIRLSLGAGSTYSGTAGSWAAANYISATGAVAPISTLSATWYITGLKLEVGSVATPFIADDYEVSFAKCQRYYQVVGVTSQYQYYPYVGANNTSTTAWFGVTFPVNMRVAPTVAASGAYINEASVGINSATMAWVGGFTYGGLLQATVASGLTAGRASTLFNNNAGSGAITYDAEY